MMVIMGLLKRLQRIFPGQDVSIYVNFNCFGSLKCGTEVEYWVHHPVEDGSSKCEAFVAIRDLCDYVNSIDDHMPTVDEVIEKGGFHA